MSFAAAALLVPAGATSVLAAWRRNRQYLLLATLPVLLGLQQLAEGFVWVFGGQGDGTGAAPFSLIYMFFAWVVWPTWIPISVYFVEPARRRTAYLVFAIAGGMLGSVQFVPYLVHSDWLRVNLLPNAVSYVDTELLDWIVGRPITYLVYVALLVAPLALSSNRYIKIFGGLVAAVAAITVAFFQWAYISVFCFGGAVISLYLVWFLRRRVEVFGGQSKAPKPWDGMNA